MVCGQGAPSISLWLGLCVLVRLFLMTVTFTCVSESCPTPTPISGMTWLEGLVTKPCPTLWNSMKCSTSGSLSFSISWNLLKLMPIESAMPSNHLILCCPLLPWPSTFPSIRVFCNELALCIRCPGQSIGTSASASVLQWIFRFDFLINFGESFSLPPVKLGSDKTTAGYAPG